MKYLEGQELKIRLWDRERTTASKGSGNKRKRRPCFLASWYGDRVVRS